MYCLCTGAAIVAVLCCCRWSPAAGLNNGTIINLSFLTCGKPQVAKSYKFAFVCVCQGDLGGPDYSWLRTRNVSAYVRPDLDASATTLMEPSSHASACRASDRLRLVSIVFSSPSNFERRRAVRATWGNGLKELPGVRVFFLLGMAHDHNTQVRYTVHREKK